MKQITINRKYEILVGICAGVIGKAVSFDSLEDRVTIVVDDGKTEITTRSDNVERWD